MIGESVILTPDSERSLAVLLRALSRSSESFSFHVIVCVALARSEVLKRLQGWSTIGNVPALLVIPNGRDGLAELERLFANIGLVRPLTGLVIPEGDTIITTESAVVALNVIRDRLAQLVNGPLVVLVSPHGAQMLQEAAPDLFDIRSGTYTVEMGASTSDANSAPWLRAKLQPVNVAYSAEDLERLELSNEPPPLTALADAWTGLAFHLEGRGELRDAAHAAQQALRLARSPTETPYVGAELDALGLLARVAYAEGRLDELELYLRDAQALMNGGSHESLLVRARRLGALAEVLRTTNRVDDALCLLAEAERLFRQLGDLDGLAASLGNRATILKNRGRLDAAMALFKETERLCRESANAHGVQTSLGGQALVLKARGQLDEALALHKEEERICRQIGSLDGLAPCLGNQALILQARGQLDEAMALHEDEARIYESIGDLRGLQISLGNQALIFHARGDLDKAIALHKKEELLCRQTGNLDGLAVSLGNQAVVLSDLGLLEDALQLFREAEQIYTQLGNLDGLQRSLGGQAIILSKRGQLDEAMDLHREEERLSRQLGNLSGVARSLGNQALVLKARGQIDDALVLLTEQDRICRDIGDPDGLARSLVNRALIHAEHDQSSIALGLAEEAERIAEKRSLAALLAQIHPFVERLRTPRDG